MVRDSKSRQRGLRCAAVCRRYCSHRIVGGPYDRAALFILDVTDASQRDGAQQRYLQPTDYLRSEFELRICQSHQPLLKVSEKCGLEMPKIFWAWPPHLSWKAFFNMAKEAFQVVPGDS